MMASPILADPGFTTVHRAVESARELSGLDGASIWALLCIGLIGCIVWMFKQERNSDKVWQEIRLKEALADQKIADAVEAMAKDITEMKILLSVRDSKGGGNV